MKTFYSFLKLFIILSVLSASAKSFAQSDEILSVTTIPGDKAAFKELRKEAKITPPASNSPSIIRNVPGDYPTIQAAINAAAIGDIVLIAAGTYREDITLNKYLKIRGANYGINPNTSIRMPETIIQPGISDPDANTYFYIGANGSGSIIDGITFDGDNNLITSGVVINGADIDAAEAMGAYDGLSNVTISNNIFKNLNYAGIDFYNYYNSGAATYDNIITDNLFDNIIPTQWGIAVLIYNNCYTDITNNVMTRVRIGIQTGNFYSADLGSGHTISGNIVESYRTGIFHNLTYTNATPFIITNNVFTTLSGAPNNNGIVLSSIGSSVGVTVTNNNVSDARAGYNLWNCTTINTVTLSGGVLTNCKTGVFANNYDGYSSNANTSTYAMTGVTMTNCDTAIWVRDNDLNTNSAAVTLNINNTTNYVNGTGIGLLIEGGDASVNFSAGDPIDFNTSLSKYIRLITNGSNVPSANINAQEIKFGGSKGYGLTNAQLFAVEDKIDHKIDWNSLGFVTIKPNNKYVTINSFYLPNTSVPLIQNGIDIAIASDTVNLGSGTFNENVILNKAITLAGSGPSSTILTPTVACTGDGITITSGNSNVKDLRITNYVYGLRTSAAAINLYNIESVSNCQYALNTGSGTNGLNIVKCKFNNNVVGGWRAGTAETFSNIMIDSSEVKGNGVGINNGFGIFIAATTPAANTADNVTIRNSDFSNNLKKGMYFEKLRNALIDNVIIDNSGTDAAYGFNNGIDINLKYDSYSNITIQNSSITNCGAMGTAVNVDNPSAVAVKARDDSPSYSSDPATLTGFTLKNCFVSGPVNGLRFGEFDKVNNSPTGNTVIENNFGGAYSNKAILNKTTNPVSVICNWYGSAAPSSVIALNGSGVNFIPYLTNGTDDDLAAAGFQIVAGSCNGLGPVKNVTQNITYPTIQMAVNAANNGDLIEVDPGTYNEQVLVNKQVTIKGVGALKPVVDFTGTVSGKPTIFDVSVPNVTLENLRIRVDMTKLNSGVIASATDIDNINIKNDSVEAYGSSNAMTFGSYGNRNAISINYGGPTNYRVAAGGVDNISVTGNTVSGVVNDGFGVSRYFRSGVSFDEGGGVFNNNTLQSINHDLLGRFGSNGNIEFKNNLFIGGGIELADMNAGAGVLTISDNTFDATFANSSAPGSAVLRLKNNYNSKTTLVNRNTLINHQWGVSLENYNTVTLDSNTFTPLASSTIYHHIAINTKSITTNSNAILQVTTGAVLTRNTFNNSGTPGGTALSFHNHDNDAASIGTFTVGTTGNENDFKNGIANFIYLDGQTGASTGSVFPDYNLLIGAGATAITTMSCWSTDVNIENNRFDVGAGLQLPVAMNFSQRNTLETNLFHKPDNACLGNLTFFLPVHNITQNTYFMTINSSIAAANPADVIECAEYTYNERVVIDKTLTLLGADKTNCKIDGTGIAGTGKGIQINNGV
ncbi:MAG TPA: DUF1565 domain-containing protein, partial [Ignavibacteria bacterium]|nr:DUF1565 domain-containing protein [Ignavibacteria bacterium]